MPSELLNIQPGELKFPFELKKQVSASLRLQNQTSKNVAFKVKTTSPKKYCVRPNTGIVPPNATIEVTVTMQAQREYPPDMQCKDKFLVQSVFADIASPKDITPELFSKESGREITETKLRVVYVSPPPPPPPINESAEEGLSPKAVEPESHSNAHFFAEKATTPAESVDHQVKARQANEHQYLEKKAPSSGGTTTVPARTGGGISWMLVLLIAVIALIIGFALPRKS
ncbi:vesicle associated protein [Klebsormidium nitens]|uniref:Vesicle associated protein n=1 Tax=Klebsormidium nitens TaxID=105231 RepID=A0A1Y1I543_KLENI|nr:vesicle associated protein [Klebsormidium nitens]|eukprot:GAQ84539.1 vesicle associated protein [Klebsormidium nitens]